MTAPYFYSASLSARFTQDIQEALSASRIDVTQSQWLARLNAPLQTVVDHSAMPRVDKLLIDDAMPEHDELASAWMITDPTVTAGPVFLSTLLSGIERFADRAALVDALTQRFALGASTVSGLEVERVDASLFQQRMLVTLKQQSHHLDTLLDQLHELPTLHQALGTALQAQIASMLPGTAIDVFSHLLQVVKIDNVGQSTETECVGGTQSLAGAAFDLFSGQPLRPPLQQRFLGEQGQRLTHDQASPYIQALANTPASLPQVYERLLADYWNDIQAGGFSRRETMARALAGFLRQTLLHERAAGRLSAEEYSRLSMLPYAGRAVLADESIRVERMALRFTDQEPVKLAGMLLIEIQAAQQPVLFMYSTSHGLRRLESKKKLIRHLISDPGQVELLCHTSLNDHFLVKGRSDYSLHLEVLQSPWALKVIDTIIGLNKRNLAHVLTLPTIAGPHLPVRVDDALDVRGLIDRRLLASHDSGRWRAGLWTFAHIWPANAQPALRPEPFDTLAPGQAIDGIVLEDTGTWFDQVQKLDGLIERQSLLHEGPQGCVRHALNRYLAIFDRVPIDAGELSVDYADQSHKSLIDVALEQVNGFNRQPFTQASRIGTTSVDPQNIQAVAGLMPDLIEQVLVLVQNDFTRLYERQTRRFSTRTIRSQDRQVDPGALAVITRERALRFEMTMERRLDSEDKDIKSMLGRVLDRPLGRLRLADGDQRLEVCTLHCQLASNLPAMELSNTFVVRASSGAGRIALWSVYMGLEGYDSLADLENALNYRLRYHDWFEHWQEMLLPADRSAMRSYLNRADVPVLPLQLHTVDGHFIQALQQAEFLRNRLEVMDMLHSTRTWQLDAQTMRNALGGTESDDMSRHQLNDVAALLEALLSKLSLPDWVRTASIPDLIVLSWLVRNFFMVFTSQPDYLYGIPELTDYAREQVQARLNADYPGHSLDPEQIMVTSTRYTAPPVGIGQIPSGLAAATSRVTETLTDYAINRFAHLQDGLTSLSDAKGQPLDGVIGMQALKSLVDSLDVATKYRDQLKLDLSEDAVDYLIRQGYFCRQIPLTEMLKAIRLKISGELSGEAFLFIGAVMTMPDALARLPMLGRHVIISPLQLWVEDQGLAPHCVTGAYVIAPLEPQRGPWVLYMILYEGFVFKEYADRSELLADLHTDQKLQAFILGRLDSDARKLYDNGGFIEPHVPFSVESSLDVPFGAPAPVNIKITPFQGNAMQLLFKDSVQTLMSNARQDSVSTAENDRLSSHYLMLLGGEQVLALLPGRVGFLLALNQAKDLFHDSFKSGSKEQWGQALMQFITALGVLLSSLETVQIQPDAEALPELELELEPEVEAEVAAQPVAFPVFSWGNNVLSAEMQVRLRQFEVHDVVLNTLQKDEAYNVYLDTRTDKRYAGVGGQVYQILFSAQASYIVIDDRVGPPIRLNQQHQWEVSLTGGLRGGGGVVSRVREVAMDSEVDQVMIVQARGMPEIRQKFRDKSQYIADAHIQARHYLENCLDNLAPHAPSNLRSERSKKIIGDFFSVPEPDELLYDTISHTIKAIYKGLLDNSLSPYRSERYVVGLSRLGHEDSLAFTFDTDSQKRIFLTEGFFQTPVFRLKSRAWRVSSFNYGTHHRAVVLLHELSHLYCKTDDIAYVDANSPYIDMLEDTAGYRKRVRDQVVAAQQRTLSFHTDRNQLFRQLKEGGWEDLRRRDKDGKASILAITRKSSLEEARDVFYENPQKRSQIMLKNADSVALFISLLGRERFSTRP